MSDPDCWREHETREAARLAMAVLFGAFLLVASAPEVVEDQVTRLPYQRSFAALDAQTRPVLATVFAATRELLFWREDEGRWPTTGELADEALPPFAPLALAGRMETWRWTQVEDGPRTRYVGAGPVPLLIQLELALPDDPTHQLEMDAHHHRLDDGTIVHVSTWYGGTSLPVRPERGGWIEVLPR